MHKLTQSLLYFSLIGMTAASMHLLVVLLIVSYLGISPLLANVFGFLVAFNISFVGHKYLTFSHLNQKLSFSHFFLVAFSAGAINELLYFLLLKYSNLNYLVALVLVLMFVAIYNYLLSRFWACR